MTEPNEPISPNDPAPASPTPTAPEITPEIQKIIDQERTRASQTARKNALKEASSDPDIIAAVRASLEEEARLSAEEKVSRDREALRAERESLAIERNTLSAKAILIDNGVDAQTAEVITAFIANADDAVTRGNAEKFSTAFKNAVETRVEAVKNELLANGGAPKQGEGAKGSEATYKEQYKAAIEGGKTAEAIAIQRKALAEGFSL